MNVILNGVEFTYDVKNPNGQKGSIFLLNGVMASFSSWSHLSDILANLGYRVILHDLRGQMLSGKPKGPYTWNDHIEDLNLLFNELKIGKAHLLGTSYGGELALCFALEHPEMIESLTVIDSVSQIDPLLKSGVDAWTSVAKAGDPLAFFNTMVPTIYGETFIKNNQEMLKKRGIAMKALSPDYLRGQIELYKTFQTLDITGRLHEITAPTLVVCGAEDTLKPPRYSKLIADKITDSRYIIIPDCGHVTIFEKPEELALAVVGFLQLLN